MSLMEGYVGLEQVADLLPARDVLYEERFLRQLADEVLRRHAIDAEAYIDAVRKRLAIGAERYGDAHFLSKDNVRELLEETPDVTGYCLLEAQKRVHRPEMDDTKLVHLFEASVHAAVADWHARQAR